ncbi:MAG: hypothetical protein PHQ03_10375 [Methylococcales bacterium]|nr:hypothetical protein [Methylococcales bacterium]
MLRTYEATLNHGQVQWLYEQPNIESARIIVTIMEEFKPRTKRQPPVSIAGKAKTLGDIISPMTDDGEWECLK